MIKNSLIYYDCDYFQIGKEADLGAVTLKYKRKCTSEEFREVNLKLLEVFEQASSQDKILIDTRDMGIVAPEDQKWVGQYIVPRLASATPQNYLKVAVITPDNIFTKLAVDTVERISMETGVCLNRNFNTVVAAKLWLQEQ